MVAEEIFASRTLDDLGETLSYSFHLSLTLHSRPTY